ncbi:Beta sliding clamp [subsurface metagenome]
MHFTCEKESILREISIAQEIISSRDSLSILSNVLLETQENRLKIKATDLKVSFETNIQVDTKEPGSTTVFCDKLLGILKSLPDGEVDFEIQEEMMFFIRPLKKKIDFKLKSIPADKYPESKEISEECYFDLPQKELIDMISKTLFAVSDDESRYFMNGVFFEKIDQNLVMVATDGRRLSYIAKEIEINLDTLKGIIIPPKILTLIKKLSTGEGNISLAIGDNNLFIRFNQHRLSSNLIDAQFPNYKRVIPENQEHRLIVERKALESALRRVSLLVEEKSRRVLLTIQPDNLIISSSEGEIGMAREEMPCQFNGPEIGIGINYLYLIDPLREMSEETVSLEFTESDRALTIKPQPEKDYFHIVMPMQAG